MKGITEPIRHDTTCRICGSSEIKTVFELNPTPPEDMYVSIEDLNVVQDVYPLVLALCENCGYLHLPFILSPEVSYSQYLYETKITLGLTQQYEDYANQIILLSGAQEGDLVIDLGSNDGTMLEAFKRNGMDVLGVEPSNSVAQIAIEKGIPTIVDFFTDGVVDTIIEKYGSPRIITANYMYANIDDLQAFTNNVARLLSRNGIFIVQTGYHPEQMKINMFDYIYHEHFSYFTLKMLRYIFERSDLDLVDAEIVPAKGGSIRAIAQLKGGVRTVSPRVDAIIQEENIQKMDYSETYISFAHTINSQKAELNRILTSIKNEGKRIVGYGASHSTTTLTYHFELAKYLDFLVDDNPLKQGRYSPGDHLEVKNPRILLEDKPDYVIILAWQYQSEIIAKNQLYLVQGGKFIIPLPQFSII